MTARNHTIASYRCWKEARTLQLWGSSLPTPLEQAPSIEIGEILDLVRKESNHLKFEKSIALAPAEQLEIDRFLYKWHRKMG